MSTVSNVASALSSCVSLNFLIKSEVSLIYDGSFGIARTKLCSGIRN